jgi:hypothetical protein
MFENGLLFMKRRGGESQYRGAVMCCVPYESGSMDNDPGDRGKGLCDEINEISAHPRLPPLGWALVSPNYNGGNMGNW